jgi:hypothetical protein
VQHRVVLGGKRIERSLQDFWKEKKRQWGGQKDYCPLHQFKKERMHYIRSNKYAIKIKD